MRLSRATLLAEMGEKGASAWSGKQYRHLTPLLSFTYTLKESAVIDDVLPAEQFTKHTATYVGASSWRVDARDASI
jgi:hypothetical protein